MVEIPINKDGHKIEAKVCSNIDCGREYLVQHGGQKSGSSPAVHVESLNKTPLGYCSIRCLHHMNGWSLEDLRKWYSSLGLDYDEIFPPDYLAPARRLGSNDQSTELLIGIGGDQ